MQVPNWQGLVKNLEVLVIYQQAPADIKKTSATTSNAHRQLPHMYIQMQIQTVTKNHMLIFQ